jgi:tRNA (guanine-N7-)-methyltransferase
MTTSLPKTRSGEPRAFFGRRAGKTLHEGQKALYQSLLPAIAIPEGEGALDPRGLFDRPAPLVLEIGYGGGEHLARQAQERPDTNFIGCEVFSGGVGKMLQAIEEGGLTNVRLFTEDALKLMMRLPDGCFEAAYLLYPDPWPKTRHHKRRFVSSTTMGELARLIRPGGQLFVATDIEDYADWTLAHVLREPRLRFTSTRAGDWHQPYPGWQPTRYERKARREGRLRSFYFRIDRVGE